MIKTLELQAGAFKKAEERFQELKTNKKELSTKAYKLIEKQITKQLKKELKLIEKQYPIEKEIEKFLNDETKD